ncbi:papain family cysteine protease domain-containing protein [Ditylenchus destructor]|nr:papain family cysteine protease domain-containing protein [Ditylenchus destructor]
MRDYNKTFSDDDRPLRLQVFANNMREIARLKASGAMGIGVNALAATTPDEFQNMLVPSDFAKNGPPQSEGHSEPPTVSRRKRQSMPSSYDYRTYSWVSSVKNQGSCGSCWAFATDALMESVYLRYLGSAYNYDLSEQDLIDCTSSPNNGCNGGWVNVALDYVTRSNTAQEYYYPYKGYKSTCASVTRNVPAVQYFQITAENDIQYYNYYYGPVAFYFNVPSAFQYYSGGVFYVSDCSSTVGMHEIVIVGYSSSYWIVKNSWGTGWGSGGFVYWARGYNMCNMQAQLLCAYKSGSG